MSGYSLDANIVIDALLNHEPAHHELRRIAQSGTRMWISRMAWIEVLSKGSDAAVRDVTTFVDRFGLDEIDAEELQQQVTRLSLGGGDDEVGRSSRGSRRSSHGSSLHDSFGSPPYPTPGSIDGRLSTATSVQRPTLPPSPRRIDAMREPSHISRTCSTCFFSLAACIVRSS